MTASGREEDALVLRPYQEECVEKVMQKNTIVVLPTGSGKTLVAVKCIDRFRLQARERAAPGADRVLFVVPTVALVHQQADYCEKHCSDHPRVARFCTEEKMRWGKDEWQNGLEDYDILVGTPDIFRRALVTNAYITPASFCLVIFDECHNAVGQHPMVSICKDSLHSHMECGGSLRIVGFTASPTKEGLEQSESEMKGAMFQLQLTLQAEMIKPIVPPEFQGASARIQDFFHVDVPAENDLAQECGRHAETFLEELLKKCDALGRIKDVSKALKRFRHVFDQLGRRAFLYAIKNVVAPQLEAKVLQLLMYTGDAPERRAEAEQIQAGLPQLKDMISNAAKDFEQSAQERCPSWEQLPLISAKASKLIDILDKECIENAGKGAAQFRCLVFVEQVSMPHPFADLINKELGEKHPQMVAGAISGGNAMQPGEKRAAIEKFRAGEFRVLVSTPTLEEGLDVPECQLVVRFDRFETTKSHIQGAGRARHREARIYYFENDPQKAHRMAKRMLDAANNPDLVPQDDDQASARENLQQKRRRLAGKHPFGGDDGGGEVNVFNCRDIVYSYLAKVLRGTFFPDSMYHYASDPASTATLTSVKYPTPDGMQTLEKSEVDEFWTGVSTQDLFDPARCKRYTTKDKEQLRFLFLVARRLREAKHLDGHNQPSTRAMEMTSMKCPQEPRSAQVSIKPKLPKSMSSQGLPNPKSALKEWCDRTWTEKGDAVLRYKTIEAPGGFKSILELGKLKLRIEGDVQKSKKLAEQAAARKAFECPEVGPA